jgi:hypothetical protein
MPALSSSRSELQPLIASVVNQLVIAVEQSTARRVQEAVLKAAGVPPRRGPGRPPKASFALSVAGGIKPRKKAPKQLCPVPGCKNAAAPIFGMVCAKHKDVPKAKIKKYREARRKAKAKA